MIKLTETCTDCGRFTDLYCSICGLPVCQLCQTTKGESLCDDCYMNDDTWMMEDSHYLDD